MGYTHYFEFIPPKTDKQLKLLEKKYQKAILECQAICVGWNKIADSDETRLSGYSAHTKVGQYGGLTVNGKGQYSCESLVLKKTFGDECTTTFHRFCKTRQYAYDTVITACLAVLKHYLGNNFNISSDGNKNAWYAGVVFARNVTKLDIKNPIKK